MVTGYSEAVSWNYLETDECPQPCYGGEDEKFQLPEISVPGLLGWLTGQQHRPINGVVNSLNIFVNFDHDCLVRKQIIRSAFRVCRYMWERVNSSS